MALAAGTRLGPYEIVAALGAGGMGEVYQARDTRLDRTVAIKVLPAELSTDPERRTRLEREARTIAALNHPHICTLHDIGHDDGTTYLVMEHLVGETLAQRLRKGALPVPQALEIGAQIAEALDAAHKAGIVHRDLKPSNVMLTASTAGRSGLGAAKLLDFGLAKLREPEERAVTNVSVPTATEPLTRAGEVLGTRPYMAPEQVEGKATDARTDLWALGCVLYEMVAGRPAFTGDSTASITAAILTQEPEPLTTRQPLTPPAFEHVVTTCLAKAPDARWQAASDVALELRWIADEALRGGPPTSGLPHATAARRRLRLALGMTGVVALALTAAQVWRFSSDGPARDLEVRHLDLGTRPADGLLDISSPLLAFTRLHLNRPMKTAVALTPDGRRLVFTGLEGNRVRLYVRGLWDREATPIDNTDGADTPFLSPDGRWVGFWAAAPSGKEFVLKKVALDGGGPPVEICRATYPLGSSWGDDGMVVFAGDSGLWRVSSNGGEPEVLTKLAPGEGSHRLPHVLPNARAVLFTVVEGAFDWKTARVVLHRFGTEGWQVLVRGAADARYVPSGHLVYFRRGQMMAVPFDLARLRPTGDEVGVVSDVMQSTNALMEQSDTGAAQAAVSVSGTLAYVAGGEVPDVRRQLVWVDRQGQVEPLAVPPKPYYGPRVSPEGQRVAVMTLQSDQRIWVHDLRVPGSMDPVTDPDLRPFQPVWTPDGQRLTFTDGSGGLSSVRADGSARVGEQLATRSTGPDFPASWTPDGQLLYLRYTDTAWFDVWRLVRHGDRWTSQELIATPQSELDPQVSPNGQWLVYTSDESGRGQVYVRRFPSLADKTPVAADEANEPVWARSGRELFYVRGSAPNDWLVAHDVAPDGAIAPAARPLFRRLSLRLVDSNPVPGFDVSPDGRRFLFAQDPDTPPPPPPDQIHIVLNWVEELKAKVPSGR